MYHLEDRAKDGDIVITRRDGCRFVADSA